MVRHIGVHRSDHAHIVDHFANMRKKLTDLDTTLAVFFKFKGDRYAAPVSRSVRKLLGTG